MFLIFNLHRLDVWPVGDFGVRKGFAVAYGLPAMPTRKSSSHSEIRSGRTAH